jgi:hypothetical protein
MTLRSSEIISIKKYTGGGNIAESFLPKNFGKFGDNGHLLKLGAYKAGFYCQKFSAISANSAILGPSLYSKNIH